MKKNTFKRVATVVSAAIILTSLPVVPLNISAANNMISNSTFESGTKDWGTYKESGGACTLTTENGKLALKVQSVGKLNYSVQVYYNIIPLYQNGVYHLKYDISSTIDREVEAMIQQNGGTYQSYTWKGLSLTSEPQTVDYEFTMEAETDIMTKFVFNCGTYGEDLPEHTIYIDNVVLELVDDSKVDYSASKPYEPSIVTNQVGYKPSAEKTAVFRDVTDEKTFSVINSATNEVVYTGELYGETNNTTAGETDWFGDFSEVTEAGKYFIKCGNLDDSYEFTIGEDAYNQLTDDLVRMLYLQRCGTEIEDDTFGHIACHNTDAVIYGTNEKIDVSGGWHDAGDYGRYVVPAAKAVADLLYAYNIAPDLYSDSIGIPESGNGIPDILDETRYELEWMLKMQSASGGVYHKVTCESFPGYIMPELEKDELIVTPVTTTATADFCGAMAMAYEYYYDVDKQFAETCLSAAEKAWKFLEENPNFIYKNPEDITTGDYGDKSDRDERYWAAAQMYHATGDSKYKTALESMTVSTGLDWNLVGDYGNMAILTMKDIDKSSDIYNKAKTAIVNQADTFVTKTVNSPYDVALTKFNWGSNMTVANAGMILGMASDITGEDKYINAAVSQLNYLLGKNPLGECFVTGYGTVSPQNPHHRPSMSKNQAMKGMLVGGVNSSLEDDAAKAYLVNTPADKCYVDNWESYSTNEITIYWNSPLTCLISMIENSGNDMPTDTIKGDVNADGKFDIADIVILKKYLLNIGEITDGKTGDMNSDGDIDIFDLSVMKHEFLNK